MKHIIHSLSIFAIVASISACSPGGGESTESTSESTASPATVTSTSNLVASADFDFRGDRDIRLSFTDFPSPTGKFVIYHGYEFYDAKTKTYYPDHTTRIASYVANTDTTYTLQALKEWQYLVLEWLPMDGKSNEQYLLLALSNNDEYQITF